MLPDNRLSTKTAMSSWKYAYPPINDFTDYCMGGVALNDSSQGLEKKIWQLRYRSEQLYLDGQLLADIDNVLKVTLAFDLNMALYYALELESGRTQMTFFDSQKQDFAQIIFEQCYSPYLMLDERREINFANADVCLFYVNQANVLCVRYQRDRFTVEHELSALGKKMVLERASMMDNGRIGFVLWSFNNVT